MITLPKVVVTVETQNASNSTVSVFVEASLVLTAIVSTAKTTNSAKFAATKLKSSKRKMRIFSNPKSRRPILARRTWLSQKAAIAAIPSASKTTASATSSEWSAATCASVSTATTMTLLFTRRQIAFLAAKKVWRKEAS